MSTLNNTTALNRLCSPYEQELQYLKEARDQLNDVVERIIFIEHPDDILAIEACSKLDKLDQSIKNFETKINEFKAQYSINPA